MKIIDYYREIQFEASKDAYKCTCHYLVIDDRGNPKPYGSGVFVKIQDFYFLLTAAHVVDNKMEDIYIGIAKHILLKLGGEYTTNIAPGHRDDDKLDIAILKLSDEAVEKIGDTYQFLSEEELGINHEIKELPMYQSIGFPASKSKYNTFKKSIVSNPFIYTTMPAKQNIYDELKSPIFSNLIVHYEKEKVFDYKTGQYQTGPDPFGISGSGLWFIPSQLREKGEKIDKKLVAIMTEWPTENRNFWIGTRIDIFTEIIRKKYNLDVEKSKIVKVDVDF